MKIGKQHDHYSSIDDQLHEDFEKLDEKEKLHMFDNLTKKEMVDPGHMPKDIQLRKLASYRNKSVGQ